MPTFSAIIPAYNEWPRIKKVIETVLWCEKISEVILIDDASKDNTWKVISSFESDRIKKIQNTNNQGKMWSVMNGIRKAKWEYIVMIDADLIGLTPFHIWELIAPILEKQCDTTLSLRENSLLVYKALRSDFVSGERVIPKEIFHDESFFVGKWFGLEVKINQKILEKNYIIGNIKLDWVITPNKSKKIGTFAGMLADIKMVWEILSQMPIHRIIHQLFLFSRFSKRARFFSSDSQKPKNSSYQKESNTSK